MSDFHIIIPARIASTRLPRKSLLDIAGLPMVIRVARQVSSCGARSITVATDDDEIESVCAQHQVACVRTANTHMSGTDRVAEAARILALQPTDIVINVQGDEPLIPPSLINAVAQKVSLCPVATAAHLIHDRDDIFNPNVVKVVLNRFEQALYFSRAPLPWWRDGYAKDAQAQHISHQVLRHYGIYGFRVQTLQDFVELPAGALEQIEALEQLRFLENGIPIAVHLSTETPQAGVDTYEDWIRVNHYLAQHNQVSLLNAVTSSSA